MNPNTVNAGLLNEATSRIPTLGPYLPNWLSERFGAQEIKRYDDSGHWVPVEESNAYVEELKRFFIE